MADVKLSQIASGGSINPATDTLVAVRNGNTDVLVTPSSGGTVTSIAVSGANGIGVSGSPITTSGTIALSLGAITPTSVAASGTVTGSNIGTMASQNANAVAITGGTITGMPSPSGGSDVATKTYVDGAITGTFQKNPCVAATTTELTVTYSNGTLGVGATLTNAGAQAAFSIDGVSPTVGQRVLISNQVTNPFQNGIYTVTTVGTVSTNWVLTRATDFDQAAEIMLGDTTIITSGNTWMGIIFYQTAVGPFTMGTTAITFVNTNFIAPTITLSGAVTGSGSTTITTSLAAGAAASNIGALSGDLSGTLPSPSVVSYNGGTLFGSMAAQASNNVAITGGTITGMPNPTNGSDVVNLTTLQSYTAGLSSRASCLVATTGALTAIYNNGASGIGATLTNSTTQAAISIDGVSLSVGNRVLVKNQASQLQNGIYTVTTVGSGATNWVLTRATDYDQSSEVAAGSYTIISSGTANIGTLWIQATSGTITIGTTAIAFTELVVGSQTITLTGDVTATGSGSIATTVAAIQGTTVSGTTGTGNVMFSASPTTTGTLSASAITQTGIYTNSTNAAASTPAFNITGTTYAAGTGTTNTPLIYINGGAAPTTWNSNGTYVAINAASGFSGYAFDVRNNGSGSAFNVSSGGTVSAVGTLTLSRSPSASNTVLTTTGTLLTGTGTTAFPQFIQQPSGATAVTTWSTAGTFHGINAGSGFTGNFVDFHINGAASAFSINQAGTITSGGAIFAGNTSAIGWTGRSRMLSSADGSITLSNAAQSGFTSLLFGGTTSSFPSIKRNSTAINFRLADDSADVAITAAAATFSGNVTVSAVNIVTDTTTGTKIGTATSQKIGFFNATPIVQPTGDVATALTNLGLVATPTVTATTNANLTGAVTSSGNATTLIGSIPFSAGSTTAVGNQTFLLVAKAAFAGTINTLLAAQTTSGTITVAIKINGTNVTGLSAVSVTSTPADTNATAANTFAIGDIITLVTSSASSDLGFGFNLKYTRT